MTFKRVAAVLGFGILAAFSSTASATDFGPFLPHAGGKIFYAFSNKYGPDAEAVLTFDSVDKTGARVSYSSTRGLNVSRFLRMSDRLEAGSFVLGYGRHMPDVIPGSTSIGMSNATLKSLRSTGSAPWAMIYDERLQSIPGRVRFVKATRMPLMIDSFVREVPVVHIVGEFRSGNKTATGDFYFLDDRANPLLIQRRIQMSWEKEPREERVVRVQASSALRGEMNKALATMRKYDLYGLHFAFDKAKLLPESKSLIDDIAYTLKTNPLWTLEIRGHTDSIGKPAYNLKLSRERAESVARALIDRGVAARRLRTSGAGETEPKASNDTLAGRAQNRRVQLIRTDR
ncbi:MAG: OmpA family protein [Hyphomicrobiaceae bacterium]